MIRWVVKVPNSVQSFLTLTRKMSGKKAIYICRCDIFESCLNLFDNSRYDVEIWNEPRSIPRDILFEKIKGKHAVLVTPSEKVDDEFLDACGEQLKVVATVTVGYDHINVDALKRRNVRLGYTPNVLDDAVAELTVAIMLTATRRLFEGRDVILKGGWQTWTPITWLNGLGLKDSTVGIIGLGRIGLEVARRLVPFKVKQIFYCNRNENPSAREVGAKRVPMDSLLKESDIVIVLCALTPETTKLLGPREFALMKNSAYLVNVSRGSVIDQDALVHALKEGIIRGAALDVMTPEPLPSDHPLLLLPNCSVVPHLGSAVVATRTAMAELTVKNIIAALEGTEMPAEVK